MIVKCFLLLCYPLIAIAQDVPPPLGPCCHPLDRPDGLNGNPFCLAGFACCPDGSWSCFNDDGQSFECGGEIVKDPKGPVCELPEWEYVRPNWWGGLPETFGGPVNECRKRPFPPVPGSRCSRFAKTCFWGGQECEEIGPLPEVRCTCDDMEWSCNVVECPEISSGSQSLCPVEINNPPSCPAENIFNFTDPPICGNSSLIGSICEYGEESCCGFCSPSILCSCIEEGEPFRCSENDACFGASCLMDSQQQLWDWLKGIPCEPNATVAILEEYPGMEVSCIVQGSPLPDDYNTDRVRIFYDPETNLVSEIPRVG